MEIKQILNIATEALDEIKAQDITTIDVESLTQMMRYMVVCTATSMTHAHALSKNLELTIKKNKVTIQQNKFRFYLTGFWGKFLKNTVCTIY